MSEHSSTSRKLTMSMLMVIALTICLTITTYALIIVSVSIPDNYFQTGIMEINLNDGKPVIEEHEFLFEPGMTVTKEFFVENRGTDDGYYKVYFTDVTGGLSDVLEITVKDGDDVLYQGTAKDFTRNNAKTADAVLQMREKRTLSISFYFPKEQGNAVQSKTLSFQLCAELVQTKNNPDRLFD